MLSLDERQGPAAAREAEGILRALRPRALPWLGGGQSPVHGWCVRLSAHGSRPFIPGWPKVNAHSVIVWLLLAGGFGAGAERAYAQGTEPFIFATAQYDSGDWDSAPLVPANLIHSIAQYTDIAVAPEGVVVDLVSEEVFGYPFLFITGHLPVRFTETEAANLKEYIQRGGFVFIDDHNHDIDGAFHRTVVAELERIFGANALAELPNDHELYRAFFRFEDGPPTTSHELNGWGDGLVHDHLRAIERNGRIAVLYSNKDYASEWSYHSDNKRFLAVDNTRFGVNVVVYALTR